MQEVKQILEREFNTKVTIQGNVVKTTVKSINGSQIWGLQEIYKKLTVNDVELKRSGTGMTIIVTLED
jgi:hypothetical protein